MKICLRLFFTMLKIGAITFGGGYAMIALLEHEFVSQKKWMEQEEFLDMIAIAESTPGPIAINCATYLGYKLGGIWGSVAATVGVCLPSFAVIYLISLFFDRFLQITYVGYAFRGIQVCVVYFILSAGFKMLKGLKKNPWNISIVACVTGAMVACSLLSVRFSSIFYILICGTLGLLVWLVQSISKKGGNKNVS